MCGIAGFVDLNSNNIDRELLKSMCNAMVHRGPDDEGYYFSDDNSEISIGLGHRRLSIIDLNMGHQPVHNETRDVWIVYNGEIYNFKDLRMMLKGKGHSFYTKSDTEVIVHAYEEYGEDVVKYLRGMFSFAIWDKKKSKLLLGRDRIGKKPLLYSDLNGKFLFASEFKALLKYSGLNKEINSEALHHYLTYLCIPSPLTVFKNIKKLPPGHILVWEKGKITLKRYWALDYSRKIKIKETDVVERVGQFIEDAVKVRLVSDVPLGVLLSGGIDSSCVTGFMKKLHKENIKTFSVGFSEHSFNELPYAKIVSDYFNTEHTEDYVTPETINILPKLVEHYGEPYADSSALATYYVANSASKRVKVVLNGDGGDEIFAGYRRHLAGYMAERFSSTAKIINRSPLKAFFNFFPDKPSQPNSLGNVRRFLDAVELDRINRHVRWVGFFSEDFKRSIYTEHFKNKVKTFDSNRFLLEQFPEIDELSSIDAILCIDTMFCLPNDLLVKMDRATMANSLESRSPLLDHHLMEFLASLPSEFKIQNFSLKYILKNVLKDMIPREVLTRPKRGFSIPIDEWFRTKLRKYLISIILSDRAMDRGYFKRESISKIVEEHICRRNNFGHHLWALLMLELWHRRFIDE